MRYRICIDRDLCQGHSMCCAEAPQLFSVSDQGQLYDTVEVLSELVAGEAYQQAIAAAAVCPNSVITLVPVDEIP